MAENRQKSPSIVGEKRGLPIYDSNPSIPDAESISKKRPVRVGNDKRGFVVDTDNGEIVNFGGAAFYEFEEVDDTRFVKLFLAGVKQAVGLSKSGLSLFELIYKEMQNTPNADTVHMSFYSASQHIEDLTDRTYRRGLRELLEREFIFRSHFEGMYFVNVRYMFNGDRLAFVKGYKRKGALNKKAINIDQGDIFDG